METVADPQQRLASDLRIGAAPGIVRRRVPELAVGVILVGLGAVAVLVLTSGDDVPEQVVVLASEISRGDQIGEDDVTFIGMTADAPISVVPAASVDRVLGRVATADMAAGSILTESQLVESSSIPTGFVVLGMRLTAGAYPSSALRPGAAVDVLGLPEQSVVGEASEESRPAAAVVLVGSVEVLRFQPLGTDPGSDVFASLLVPDSARGEVAAAAGAGRIWLAEVAS